MLRVVVARRWPAEFEVGEALLRCLLCLSICLFASSFRALTVAVSLLSLPYPALHHDIPGPSYYLLEHARFEQAP
jgi:hypothetical protein